MNARAEVAARPRCLLVLPRTFYGFAAVVERGLRELGYEVETANDEYPESLLGKLMSKLGLSISLTLTRRALTRLLQGRQFDLLIIIKGRGLDAAMAAELRRHARHAVGYHFDAFRYDAGPARWVHELPRVCTFDYRDAAEHQLPVVELFSSLPDAPPATERPYRISAIMRNHSQRLAFLDRVLRATGEQDAFIHIFEANAFTFVANFLRHPRLYLKYRRYISRRSLPYAEYVKVLSGSQFTIDYAHPSQTGITIRSFEALSAGTRIITNNPYVLRSVTFEGSGAIVLGPGDTGQGLLQRMQALAGVPSVARRRSVTDFLHELIGRGTPTAATASTVAAQRPAHGHAAAAGRGGQPLSTMNRST
jgi:hypothetical protein